ncbi:NAD(P)H-binding protein [Nonomuraea roseoviolacea subsp. roseoviolacea]|uniref:NAD(P)H-binding protein n=1 Tax=Nonomuraea roseoviolacea TaxID=103837 RepID=UPI0031DCBE3B
MTILVTGARGAVAQHLTALLRERGAEVREASAAPAPGLPDRVVCDLNDPATFAPALKGVTSVFLYANAAHAGAFAREAAEAGVEHIVLLSSASVLHPDAATNPLAASHLNAERALLAGTVRTTLLRPGSFSSNALAWSWAIKAGDPVALPYPDAHNDPIHTADVAAVALAVLTSGGEHGAAHTLTGPRSVTFAEQLDVLAGVLGRPVGIRRVSPEQWKQDMSAYMNAGFADALLDYWSSCVGKPVEITDTVERLTGRPARDFETWAREHADDFAPAG